MSGINVNGGLGNEAIEIGLWHANTENEKDPISQVILIGDMPANINSKIPFYRNKYFGEEYWSKSKFIEKLKSKNKPVNAFNVLRLFHSK